MKKAEAMLSAGADAVDVARAVSCPLTSVDWIAAGDHPRQRLRAQEAERRLREAEKAREAAERQRQQEVRAHAAEAAKEQRRMEWLSRRARKLAEPGPNDPSEDAIAAACERLRAQHLAELV